jgi:hypothetical protein
LLFACYRTLFIKGHFWVQYNARAVSKFSIIVIPAVIRLKRMECRNLLTHCLYGDSGIHQKDGGTGMTARSHIIEEVSGREVI